jgi:hypothetical protein
VGPVSGLPAPSVPGSSARAAARGGGLAMSRWYGHPDWEYGIREMNGYCAEIGVHGEIAVVNGHASSGGNAIEVIRFVDGMVCREWMPWSITAAIYRAEAIMRGAQDVEWWRDRNIAMSHERTLRAPTGDEIRQQIAQRAIKREDRSDANVY